MKKYSMNEDIKKYPIFFLYQGKLLPCEWIKSTNDYNHNDYNLHHYIKRRHYVENKQWYDKRGIQQKLIYMPFWLHKQVHNEADRNLTDAEFEDKFLISRWDLFFNRKHTKY